MTKKSKSVKKDTDPREFARHNLLRANQMMQFARQPKRGRELAALLQGMDLELESAYQLVREMPCGDPDEDAALEAVRELENRRFALLSQMHGNKILAYRQG